MPILFESSTINSIHLKNRIVRSATWEGLAAEDGSCTPRLIDVSVQLAKGGVGLVITGHAFVSSEGRAGSWQLGVYSDDLLPGLRLMTESVHDAGGRIVMQLAHSGVHANPKLTGAQPLGPSVAEGRGGAVAAAMKGGDIRKVVDDFGRAAGRAQRAGFDGVQIHAAHGYLMSQFLSPAWNKRGDGYGGTVENRLRIIIEALSAIRHEVGPDFAVMIKLNSEDFVPDGFTQDEMLEVVRMLDAAGIDAVELSGGTFYSGDKMPSRVGKLRPDEEAWYRDAARRFKQTVTTPLMLVGGIRSYEVAESLVQDGVTDYVAFCRPLIREPGLANRWASGDTRPATCVSDSGCFKPGFEGKGVSCVVEARQRGTESTH
jgi:2,4-dienoyl-CoA reductase-like NADH-dependent reductase (Old Yellow Enzyme family)